MAKPPFGETEQSSGCEFLISFACCRYIKPPSHNHAWFLNRTPRAVNSRDWVTKKAWGKVLPNRYPSLRQWL